MPGEDWATDAAPAAFRPPDAMGFHIVAGGRCWIDFEGRRIVLETGDVALFPFGSSHVLGAGSGALLINPGLDLPPAPWSATPTLRYGEGPSAVRVLCGYVRCEAMNFRAFRDVLPLFVHERTLAPDRKDWLAATIAQIVDEVDRPQRGGSSVLERLTEVALVEVVRRRFVEAPEAARGWLAAIADPVLGRCLDHIHGDPGRAWTLEGLAAAAGQSRSALSQRFQDVLDLSPIRYLREWRLCLAAARLRQEGTPIVTIAEDAGYATEAAFSRAFSRAYGIPPAEWRLQGRRA